MRRKQGISTNMSRANLLFALFNLCAIISCEGRRTIQRRKDTLLNNALYTPEPSAESLRALAHATGAAEVEHYTEGKALVKRLIPDKSQPDLDVVEHQGVIGRAGVDFPAFPTIPNTGFNCKNVLTGYYADLETDCQVFHICDTSRKISFLCPNGTIFSQSHLICDWWFKVDCASAPTLYESSAEYYSNEQRKSQKVVQSLSKNPDLQQIDTNIRAESRRTSVNIPSTTERLLRHRQRLQTEFVSPLGNVKVTPRSFSAFGESNYNPTQRAATTPADKRRKNLVQLIATNFGNLSARSTLPTYTESSTYRTTLPAGDYNSIKEMQIAAESASFANNNNRQYLQDYTNKNYRPYSMYSSNLTPRPKTKSSITLTTLYDIRDKTSNQLNPEIATKRPTLSSYTKSYTTNNDRREPYTRPGVSLLKDYLEKEKNKTFLSTTEKFTQAADRSFATNVNSKIKIESKNSFETATKIPQTTRSDTTHFTETASSDNDDIISSTVNLPQTTTDAPYQERRERLQRKLDSETITPTEISTTEKYYGDQPKRPGLIVPPSLTPKTLHSLAIYYATALDNLSTTETDEDVETTTIPLDEYEAIDELPGLFSRHTINKYGTLFGEEAENAELLQDIKLDPNGTYNELVDDLAVQQSQNPLATSPQIRELAQVFTHALSAYLQDPVKFRKVLSDIRPTHPSFAEIITTTEETESTEPTTTVNEDDDEILGFSDDHKYRPSLASLRDGKALNIATEYSTNTDIETTTVNKITTETEVSTPATTFRSLLKCCGRISASYTTASTPLEPSSTVDPFTNTIAASVNTLTNNYSDTVPAVTENVYTVQRFGGFQNNTQYDSPYGSGLSPTDAKPLSEYLEVTNLPTAWGVDTETDATTSGVTASHIDIFESKKIKSTYIPTTTPVYFTKTDSIELENEEELQRAHSQSFVSPDNNFRQDKQLNIDDTKITVKKPSEDLEAPTETETDITTDPTTIQQSTEKLEVNEGSTSSPEFSSIFTSPDSEVKTTYQFPWANTYENWQSTIILDPITLNDGLSQTGQDNGLAQITGLTGFSNTEITTAPSIENTGTSEPVSATSYNVEVTTPSGNDDLYVHRSGRFLKASTSTEPAQDLTTIADTVVQKAKEIMEGMNSTTTEKLMNVMKKTKSKSVKRLILLLVQTCDDDHNSTAEASKKALLEALMAVSQKDMEEIAKEESMTNLSTTTSDYEAISTTKAEKGTSTVDGVESLKPRHFERRAKSLVLDPKEVNLLSSPTTTDTVTSTTELYTETASTTSITQKPTPVRRGGKKFLNRTTPNISNFKTAVDNPVAEARVASQDLKTPSDTRAIELLRSLYTIAARWG